MDELMILGGFWVGSGVCAWIYECVREEKLILKKLPLCLILGPFLLMDLL